MRALFYAVKRSTSNRLAPAAHDQVKQEEQDNRADERREDGAREAAEWCADAELTKDPAADKGAHDADDDVADQSNAANHQRGKDTGNQPDNQPREEVHNARFLWKWLAVKQRLCRVADYKGADFRRQVDHIVVSRKPKSYLDM